MGLPLTNAKLPTPFNFKVLRCWPIVEKGRGSTWPALGKYALNVQIEQKVDQSGKRKQADSDQRNQVHLASNSLQVLKQFLLLQCIAVRCLAHHLQMVFNPLQRCILLRNVVTEFTMLLL